MGLDADGCDRAVIKDCKGHCQNLDLSDWRIVRYITHRKSYNPEIRRILIQTRLRSKRKPSLCR